MYLDKPKELNEKLKMDLISVEESVNLRNISRFFKTPAEVSMEGIGDVITGFGNLLIRKFNSVINFFSSNSSKNLSENTKEVISAYHKRLVKVIPLIEKINKKENVNELMSRVVLKPSGFKISFLDGSIALKDSLALILSNLYNDLDSLDTQLSNVLSLEEVRLASRSPIDKKIFKKINTESAKVLDHLLDPNSQDELDKVRNLLPNLNSLSTIQKNLLESSRLSGLESLKKVKNVINNIKIKADEFSELAYNNKNFIIKKNILTDIVDIMQEGAEAVTHSSAVITTYISLTNYFILLCEELVKDK